MENTTGTSETRYKIIARIDLDAARLAQGIDDANGYVNTDGYNVHDYFQTAIDGIYTSRDMAEEVAESGYKGPDVDGVGCTWEVVEVDADHYQPTGN